MRPVLGRRQQCMSGRQRATQPRTPRTGLPVTVPRLTASLQVTQRSNRCSSGSQNLPCADQVDLESLLRPTQNLLIMAAFQVLLQRSRRMQIHAARAPSRAQPADVPRPARQSLHNSPLRDCGKTPARTPHRAAHGIRQPSHPAAPAAPDGRPRAAPSRTCRAGESLAWRCRIAGMPKNGPTP